MPHTFVGSLKASDAVDPGPFASTTGPKRKDTHGEPSGRSSAGRRSSRRTVTVVVPFQMRRTDR